MSQEKLQGMAIFRGLPEGTLEEFAAYFTQSSCPAGEVIFRERSAGDTLFIIVDGEVVIEKAMDEEDREFKALAILSGGDFFGEMAVLEAGQPRSAQARASKDTSLYEIHRDKFFAFIKEHPQAGIGIFTGIMRTVFRRLQHTSSELTMLFDLSRLLLLPHRSPAEFLSAVMDEMKLYMDGVWSVKAYVYNRFNEEYEPAYSREGFPGGAAARVPERPQSGWLDDRAYLMACEAEGRRLAAAVFERSEPLSAVEKNNLATIFNTISSILGSAVINIEHQAEAAMMEKLRNRKNTI